MATAAVLKLWLFIPLSLSYHSECRILENCCGGLIPMVYGAHANHIFSQGNLVNEPQPRLG